MCQPCIRLAPSGESYGGKQAWHKVMAAYRRVDGLVTCGLTAYIPGSALGPMLGNEYGRTLPFVPDSLYLTVSFRDILIAFY